MPVQEDLLVEQSADGVLRVTLNRPEAANALTPDQRNRLIDVFGEASADLATRVVLLTAAGGRHFCTGADLRASQPPRELPAGAPDRPVGTVARIVRTGAGRLISSVIDCEKPVIAAVNGTAAGIGAHLAFACDLVLAADNARFVEVFVRRGITPDGGGAWLLTRLLGPQKAKELVFFGDTVDAPEAERIGLCNRVVPAAELTKTADEWAGRLAASPTTALSWAKWQLNRAIDVDRRVAFEDEALAQEVVMGSADAQEGVAAFVERRAPIFRGW
jgi:2-(1,2-epoxy-1,2-dihydrophenyl)acetyl-CoA isomerase